MEQEEIFEKAKQLFQKHWNGDAVRLLGVTAFDVVEKEDAVKQLDLFSYETDARKEPLYKAMDELKKKYGKTIIRNAAQAVIEQKKKSISQTSFSKDVFDDFPK